MSGFFVYTIIMDEDQLTKKVTKHIDEFNLMSRIGLNTTPVEKTIPFVVDRMKSLDEIDLPEGVIVECGVYRGATSIALHRQYPDRKLYLLDSFQGYKNVPADEIDRDPNHDIHDERFTNNSSVLLSKRLFRAFGEIDVEIGASYFEDWPESFSIDNISILYIDCDLYTPVTLCIEKFWNNVNPGGIVAFPGLQNRPKIVGLERAIDEQFGLDKLVDNFYIKK